MNATERKSKLRTPPDRELTERERLELIRSGASETLDLIMHAKRIVQEDGAEERSVLLTILERAQAIAESTWNATQPRDEWMDGILDAPSHPIALIQRFRGSDAVEDAYRSGASRST